MEFDLTSDLKAYLGSLPQQFDYKFTGDVRREILRGVGTHISSGYPNIFQNLFPFANLDEDGDAFQWKLEEYPNGHSHPGRPCSKKFLKGDPCYRCLTCSFDESCALCADCFNSQDHRGHEVHKTLSQRDNSGVCDCGDPEAWSSDVYCKYSEKRHHEKLTTEEEQVISTTLAIIVDYILDVMSTSTSVTVPLSQPEQIQHSTVSSSFRYSVYSLEDKASSKYSLVLYNDQIHQNRDAVQRVHIATGKVIEFARMIVDRVNTYGKATVMTSVDINYLIKKHKLLTSTGLTASIKNCRDVFKEEVSDELISWLLDFTRTDLFLNYEFVQNEFCKVFLSKWEKGLYGNPPGIYGLDQIAKDKLKNISLINNNEIPYFYHTFAETRAPWDISKDLMEDCNYTYHDTLDRNSFTGSRFQYLLFFDIRFCKLARSRLHDLYIFALVTNLKYKSLVTIQYIDIYPQLAKLFLIFDREPEMSILPALSIQIFTSPSSCTMIARHGDLYRMILLVYIYLSPSRKLENHNELHRFNRKMLYQSLKNRKWGHIFLDMTYIINRNKDNLVVFSPFFTNKIIDVLILFQSNPCMKREAMAHVEYESTDYGLYFNAMSVISHFAETIGKAANKVPLEQCHFITTFTENVLFALYHFSATERSLPQNESNDLLLVSDKEDMIAYHDVELIDGVYKSVKCDVSSDKVSFLHPLHSLLSWLMEYNKNIFDTSDLQDFYQIFDSNFKDSDADIESFRSKAIFDFPLRTLVLISQIKVGMWVRNGLSVKNQMNIYKNSGIREFGYSRDLFLVQTYMAALPPNVTIPAILDRWGLADWSLKKDITKKRADTSFLELIEEFFLFHIHILTEDLHLHNRTAAEILDLKIKREIIQTLCFRPMTYSALTSEIPDHITAEKRFFVVFQQVAQEIPNSSAYKESKSYELKPELYDEVNPYYFHYTSNKREDAVKLLKKRIQERDSIPLDRVILPIREINWEKSPFKNMTTVIYTKLFANNIHRGFEHAFEMEQNSDNLLELTLRLLHICIKLPGSFKFIRDYVSETNIPTFLYGILLIKDKPYFHAEARMLYQRIMEVYNSCDIKIERFFYEYEEEVAYPTEKSDLNQEMEIRRKKKLSKKKKQKILAKFKKQQEEFAQNFMNSDIMDTSDEDGKIDKEAQSLSVEEDNITGWPFPVEHCILCQMPASKDELFGITSNISQSSAFRSVPFEDEYWFYKSFSDNYNLCGDRHEHRHGKCGQYLEAVEKKSIIGPGFPANEYECESILPVISSCCHGMHFSCFKNYIENFKNRQPSEITRTLPEDLQRGEFLCPLCKAVNNVFIPIFYSTNKESFTGNFKTESNGTVSDINISTLLVEEQEQVISNYSQELIERTKSKIQNRFLEEESGNLLKKKCTTFLRHSSEFLSSLIVPYETLEGLIANTIKSVEISLRGVPIQSSSSVPLILNQLSNQVITQLRVWNQFKEVIHVESLSSTNTSVNLPSSGAHELNYCELSLGLLVNLDSDLSTIYEGEDFFKFLVSIDPIESVGLDYHFLVGYIFKKHVIQSMMMILARVANYQLDIDECSFVDLVEFDEFDIKEDDYELISAIYLHFAKEKIKDARILKVIYGMLIKLVTPFLRCAAIYSYIKFAVINEEEWVDLDQFKLEADKLSFILNIPSTVEMLREIVKVDEGFSSFKCSKDDVSKLLLAKMPYPGIIKLISLPDKIFDFFTNFNNRKRNMNPLQKKFSDPAICLFCAEVLELQVVRLGDKYGACNMHALNECMNGGIGIFLMPRTNSVLLLYKNKGSFFESPYIDDHGENEADSKKGHDLHLSKVKYDEFIRNVWLSHNVQNQIARKLESQMDFGGWITL